MFSNLIVNHFKSIEQADIGFGQINIFVGNNGSGKSNVIDAIRFIKEAVQNGLDRAVSDRHGIDSVRQWSPTRPFRISLTIKIAEGDTYGTYSFSVESAKGQFKVAKEEANIYQFHQFILHDEEGNPTEEHTQKSRFILNRDKDGKVFVETFSVNAPSDKFPDLDDDDLFKGVQGSRDNYEVNQLDDLAISFRSRWEMRQFSRRLTEFQAYSIYPNTLRIPQEPSNETYLTSEGRNLASVFKNMRRNKRGIAAINQITESMRYIMPNLERISVLNVGGFLVPQFHIVEPNGKKHIFNVSQMSDGTLRILGLLTALYQEPRPRIIALEEPEQTVNPGILTVLADSIKEVSKTSQIIVTTHSPNLLDHFDPDQIRAVEMIDSKTYVNKINALQASAVKERLFTLGELLSSEGLHG